MFRHTNLNNEREARYDNEDIFVDALEESRFYGQPNAQPLQMQLQNLPRTQSQRNLDSAHYVKPARLPTPPPKPMQTQPPTRSSKVTTHQQPVTSSVTTQSFGDVRLTPKDVFERAALIEQCAQSDILRHVDTNTASVESLRTLLNLKNARLFQSVPIILSKLVVKIVLQVMTNQFPRVGTFINPSRIMVRVEDDELEFLATTESTLKPNLVIIVAKNILFSVMGNSIEIFQNEAIERVNAFISKDNTGTQPPHTIQKIPVLNAPSPNVPVILEPPEIYSDKISNHASSVSTNSLKKPVKRLNSSGSNKSPSSHRPDSRMSAHSGRSSNGRRSPLSKKKIEDALNALNDDNDNDSIRNYFQNKTNTIFREILASKSEDNEIPHGDDAKDNISAGGRVIDCQILRPANSNMAAGDFQWPDEHSSMDMRILPVNSATTPNGTSNSGRGASMKSVSKTPYEQQFIYSGNDKIVLSDDVTDNEHSESRFKTAAALANAPTPQQQQQRQNLSTVDESSIHDAQNYSSDEDEELNTDFGGSMGHVQNETKPSMFSSIVGQPTITNVRSAVGKTQSAPSPISKATPSDHQFDDFSEYGDETCQNYDSSSDDERDTEQPKVVTVNSLGDAKLKNKRKEFFDLVTPQATRFIPEHEKMKTADVHTLQPETQKQKQRILESSRFVPISTHSNANSDGSDMEGDAPLEIQRPVPVKPDSIKLQQQLPNAKKRSHSVASSSVASEKSRCSMTPQTIHGDSSDDSDSDFENNISSVPKRYKMSGAHTKL